MNQLSLRNDQLKFITTSGKLPTVLEGIYKNIPRIKEEKAEDDNMCYDEIGLCAPIMDTILSSTDKPYKWEGPM